MAATNSTAVLKTFVFGSWVCIANGSSGFTSHLTKLVKPEAPPTVRVDRTDDVNEFRLSNLIIRNYLNELKSIPHPRISNDDLINGVDHISCNISECINLAETALWQHDNKAHQEGPSP